MPRGRFTSFLQGIKMISKGCSYHVVRVRDVDSETPSHDSVPLGVPRIFPKYLSGIPLERENRF